MEERKLVYNADSEIKSVTSQMRGAWARGVKSDDSSKFMFAFYFSVHKDWLCLSEVQNIIKHSLRVRSGPSSVERVHRIPVQDGLYLVR